MRQFSDTSDIRGRIKAKAAFEAKGYNGRGLVKLLILTHRMWTPSRMQQFYSRISSADDDDELAMRQSKRPPDDDGRNEQRVASELFVAGTSS